jgi:hypothetical protein
MLTPISTPYTSEYKPLGLESFAAPLSKMQEKFDIAKSEIDKTKYALSRLSKDDERAKKLLLDLDAKTNELSQNLSRSGNYKQATQQLKQLNEFFTSNKELSGMRSNYDSYKENYKIMRDRVDGTNMTEKDFELWDYNVRNKFKGTNYDKATGTYNTGDFSPKSFNLEKELEDKVLQIAGMENSSQQLNAILNTNPNADPGQVSQQLIKSIEIGDVQRSIRNFILTGDRFKNWKAEEAQMEFFMKNDQAKKAVLQGMSEEEDPLYFSKNAIKRAIPELQEIVDDLTKLKNNEEEYNNLSEEQKATLNQTLKENEEKMGELYSLLDSNDPDAIEQEAGGIYLAEQMGYFDKIALAGADVVDFINEGAITFSGGNSKKNEKIKEAQALTINTQLNPVNVMKESSSAGGTAPGAAEENLQLEPVEYTMTDLNEFGEEIQKTVTIEPASSVGELYQNNVTDGQLINGIYFTSDVLSTLKETPTRRSENKITDAVGFIEFENNEYAKTTVGYEEMFDARINKLGDNIKLNQTKLLDPNLKDEEIAELESLIATDRREKYQAQFLKTSQLKDLDYLVTDYLHDKPEEELVQLIKDSAGVLEMSDEDILKSVRMMKENFNSNTVSSPRFLNNLLNTIESSSKKEGRELTQKLDAEYDQLLKDASVQFLGKNFEDLTEDEQTMLVEDYLEMRTDTMEEGYEDLPEEQRTARGELFMRYEELDREIGPALKNVDLGFNPGELLINKIFKDYRKSKTLGTEQFYQIPEIVIDESSDKFSGGQFKSLVEDSMLSRGSQNFRVFWDPSTRQSVELDPGGLAHSFTLDAYRTDNPRFAGIDQNDNVIIAFYRKSALTDQNQNLKEWEEYVDKGSTPVAASTRKAMKENAQVKFSQADLNKMQKNNPDVLYISSAGLSQKPVEQITENFVDYIESASTIANEDSRIEFIEKQRANYAPFYMASSPEIAASYNKFANTLQYRALNGIDSEINQTAASQGVISDPFQDANGNVVTREYNARYQTQDGEIKVQYTEVIRDADSFEIVSQTDLPALTISNQVNLPTALAKLDLTFGTGATNNLKYTTKGGRRVPLVLANLNPSIYRDPKRMNNIIK